MPENEESNNASPPPEKPTPNINLERLEELEEKLIEKAEKRLELKSLEDKADAEIETIEKSEAYGSAEQVLFLVAAALLLISLPFVHVIFGIILALFTIVISLLAGLTSSKQPISATLNLAVSLIGLTLFEYSAIIAHANSISTFWFYQLLALIFLFCTFFSTRTYRKKNLES